LRYRVPSVIGRTQGGPARSQRLHVRHRLAHAR
jgi:hypothetical protein